MRKLPDGVRKGFQFAKLFSVEMNNYDPEMLLPGLFYLVRCQGQDRQRASKDTDSLKQAQKFAANASCEGFDGEDKLRLVHEWTRTSFVHMTQTGQRRNRGEIIYYLRPLSFLSYKPAFPVEHTRHRNVHRFLYQLMAWAAEDHLQRGFRVPGRAANESPGAALIRLAFSEGIVLSPERDREGRYDDKTPLDTEVLAFLRYLEGFEAIPPAVAVRGRTAPVYEPALPVPARSIADDIVRFLSAYATRMPTLVLAEYLTDLLAVELATYTLRLMHATIGLVHRREKPADMTGIGALSAEHIGLYCDVTEGADPESASLAGQCVARDTEIIEQFHGASLVLRTVDQLVEDSPPVRQRFDVRQGAGYLSQLPGLVEDPYLVAAAGMHLSRISEQWHALEADDETAAADELLTLVREERPDAVLHLVELLRRMQRKNAIGAYNKWYASIFGLDRDTGLLRRTGRTRTSWRYVLTPSLVECLLQLCAVDPGYRMDSLANTEAAHEDEAAPGPVLLSDFVRFLRERFGILVDCPPAFRGDSEARQAAQANVGALKTLLRQLGLYQELSDDFNAQIVYPRFRSSIRDIEAERRPALEQGSEF